MTIDRNNGSKEFREGKVQRFKVTPLHMILICN